MTSLLEALRARTNDYGPLEKRFRDVTGRELIPPPLEGDPVPSTPIASTASVVIAAWNARNTIRQVLLALEASTFNSRHGSQLEVVVVDDGSTDDTWQILKALRCNLNLHLIRQENTGQYRALNTAIEAAQGGIVISCDDDMILMPRAIEALMLRHDVLDDVLLIGFRYDGAADDPRIQPDRVVSELEALPAAFERDERVTFHWPGWPESLCAETDHLRRLDGAQQMYVTDGETPDGDAWDLPRMVYGALFSLPRREYIAMGAYDEQLVGWGFGDTLIGAKAYALGSYIVPVYEAVGFHVAHADRRPDKWADADRNLARLEHLRGTGVQASPFGRDRTILDELHRCRRAGAHGVGRCDSPAARPDDACERGFRHLALAQYRLAIDAFARAPEPLRLAGQGRAFERLGDGAAARACFEEWTSLERDDGESAARLAMALAAEGRFDEGRRWLAEARARTRNVRWARYLTGHAADAHARRGRKYLDQRLYDWAARDFEAALLHEPGNGEWAAAREACHAGAEG